MLGSIVVLVLSIIAVPMSGQYAWLPVLIALGAAAWIYTELAFLGLGILGDIFRGRGGKW